METLGFLIGIAIAAGFGYLVGLVFNQNKRGVHFEPWLWALLGGFFGLQGILIGCIYGLLKIFVFNK